MRGTAELHGLWHTSSSAATDVIDRLTDRSLSFSLIANDGSTKHLSRPTDSTADCRLEQRYRRAWAVLSHPVMAVCSTPVFHVGLVKVRTWDRLVKDGRELATGQARPGDTRRIAAWIRPTGEPCRARSVTSVDFKSSTMSDVENGIWITENSASVWRHS